MAALELPPESQRARGRPKDTWRKSFEKARNNLECKRWSVAKAATCNRKSWFEIDSVKPYAATGQRRGEDDDDDDDDDDVNRMGRSSIVCPEYFMNMYISYKYYKFSQFQPFALSIYILIIFS